MTQLTEELIRACATQCQERTDLWIHILRAADVRRMAEVGVYRADFAAALLEACGAIEKYYMIDPWRHLADWNKPANARDDVFEQFLAEAVAKTEFAAGKRALLRGKTTEVIDDIQDGELDFAYIDGDHTLKGITIDLIRVLPKVRVGGWIGGDDFSRTVWQHDARFEPTLVFPFAVYFAEAVGARIYALPHSQFLIEKDQDQTFAFVDLVGHYADLGLGGQFRFGKVMLRRLAKTSSWLTRLAKRVATRTTVPERRRGEAGRVASIHS